MKRITLALILAACLVQPASAASPLVAIVLDYVKEAVKDAVISHVRSKVTSAINERLPNSPALALLGALVPELGVGPGHGVPTLPPEAAAAMKASGLMDAEATPLTEQEWQAYERIVMGMSGPGSDVAADLAQMRSSLAEMPQMAGLVRMQLDLFREIDEDQARMREAYAQMSEAERQQVVDEMLTTLKELSAEEQVQARAAIDSPALGLPEDLRDRLKAATAG